jgi:phage terminase small subunit
MGNTAKSGPRPLNVRQEKFAQLVAGGMPAIRAYVKAGYSSNGRNPEGSASRLMLDNAGVAQRIAELKAGNEKRSEFTRDDMVQWLVDALKTPVGNIDETHHLAQEMVSEEIFVEQKGGQILKRRIKTVGKNECARLLCDMMGWKAPEKREIDLGDKTLDAVREKAANIVSPLARLAE